MRGLEATTTLTYRFREQAEDRESSSEATRHKTRNNNASPAFATALADALAPLVAPRRLLFLKGALGTGKTQLARALVQAVADRDTLVPSPTFALLQSYETRRGAVLHADLYRLTAPQTLDLGLEEALQEGFVIIEWAERLHPTLREALLSRAELLQLRLAYFDEETCIANLTLPSSLVSRALRALQQDKESSDKESNDKALGERLRPSSLPTQPAISQAFVLAAGLGRRMRSYAQKPKPLVKVGGKPLLCHTIEKLRAHGIDKIFVNAHYRADAVRAVCDEFAEVVVLEEPVLLETGGGIARALPLLGEQPFFAVNADALWHDPPSSKNLLACLEEAWQRLAQKKQHEKQHEKQATTLLALLEQPDAHDVQAQQEDFHSGEPFPLVFPVSANKATSKTTSKATSEASSIFRYIGVQVLTARAFRALPKEPKLAYGLKRLYEMESAAGRLYGMTLDAGVPTSAGWHGTWLHVGDRAALGLARRTWKKLTEEV